MPARPPKTPRAFPARLVIRGWLPQNELRRVFFVRRHLDAGAGDQFVPVVARQATVIGHRGNIEQDMTVGRVGMFLVQKRLDQFQHFRNMAGGAGLLIRLKRAQGRHVGVELVGGAPGDIADSLAGFFRRMDDLVVHIGDIAHIRDGAFPIDMAEQPVQHIEHDHRARIADMGNVIDGGPTHIHAHIFRIQRREFRLGAG